MHVGLPLRAWLYSWLFWGALWVLFKKIGGIVGMKESEEFAGELFDALARRRGITSGRVSKLELREFWEQISDQSFDSRLQTFFDM